MTDETIPFHPLVAKLLEDVEAGDRGPALPVARVQHWGQELAGRNDKREIAVQLVVLAMRFRNHDAMAAMLQMIVLAATLLDDLKVQELLEAQGLPAAEAQTLVGQTQAQGVTSPLADGLAPPGGGVKRR